MDTYVIKKAIEKYEGEYNRWKFDFLVERLINPTAISWSELIKDKPIKESSILNVRLNFIIKEELIRDEFAVGTWHYEITQKGIDWLKNDLGNEN